MKLVINYNKVILDTQLQVYYLIFDLDVVISYYTNHFMLNHIMGIFSFQYMHVFLLHSLIELDCVLLNFENLSSCLYLQELIEELKIYFLSFDRPGYGESDPHPLRTVKTEACDVEQLADKLQIGSKFYVIGISMGAYPVYGCLKYIPQRHETYVTLLLVFPFTSLTL